MEVVFTAAATRQWLKLAANVRDRLNQKLMSYAETRQGDVKILKGREGARLRVGDWRIIFTASGSTLTVVAVGHRREIYD